MTSELWGTSGEAWDPAGRLPDFSFAGYRAGAAPPEVPVAADVRDFGAVGDGETDCTGAFRKAVAATERGAILIPQGRYVIRDIIWIEKPGVVLRGEGADKTVILPRGELEDIRPNMGATTAGAPTSNYSWSGGFLWARGNLRETPLTGVTADAERGGDTLRVADAAKLRPGQAVTLHLTDDGERSLVSSVYAGDPGPTGKLPEQVQVRLHNRVAVIKGDSVRLERPLRLDVRRKWKPSLHAFDPTVSEVGIERLAIEFPVKPYAGHFTERGMNAIAMNGVADCWVRDVRVANADSGVFLSGQNCTIDGIVLASRREPHGGTTGHHGITAGSDCLVMNFDFQTHFIHDFTLSGWNSGNVFKNGRGINLSFDHHKKGPFENLFCNIDIGGGREIWRCGGGEALGKHCAARGTFWALVSRHPVSWPPAGFGPEQLNLVGISTGSDGIKEPAGRWFETMDPAVLEPKDLHAAQLRRRLESAGPPR